MAGLPRVPLDEAEPAGVRRERHAVAPSPAASRADALDKLLNALPRRSKSAAKALKGAGLSLSVTRKRAVEAQRGVADGDVPTRFRKLVFKLMGQSGPDGRAAAEEFLRDFVATSPSKLTGRFPQALIAPRILRSYRNEANAMHSFAKQTRAKPPSLAPSRIR